MDESEKVSAVIALNHLLEGQAHALDLLVSAFAAAVRCGRRATVCKPFPTHIFGAEGFDAAAAAVQAVDLLQLEAASVPQLQLLQWLLLQLQRTWIVGQCPTAAFIQDLQHVEGHSGMYAAVQQSCSIFRVLPASGLHQHSNQGRRIIAYHGTDFANVHSILHQGLLAASGTRLQTTGAVFGQGIYLSTDFSTAFQYTKGREGWQHSTLGGHLRCVLVCEVAEEATVPESITRTGKHSSLPMTYIVAPRPSDVQIKFLLVFSDDALLGRTARVSTSSTIASSRGTEGAAAGAVVGGHTKAVNFCWLATAAYLGLMVCYALWKWCVGSLKRQE